MDFGEIQVPKKAYLVLTYFKIFIFDISEEMKLHFFAISWGQKNCLDLSHCRMLPKLHLPSLTCYLISCNRSERVTESERIWVTFWVVVLCTCRMLSSIQKCCWQKHLNVYRSSQNKYYIIQLLLKWSWIER